MVAVDQHQIQETGSCDLFFLSIFFEIKTQNTLDFWLQPLAQEAVISATGESLEEVFDFKSFVLPNMLLCNLYIAGSRGEVGDAL